MNAPYDGDRGQDARPPASPSGPPEPGQVPPQQNPDAYAQGHVPGNGYDQNGYPQQGYDQNNGYVQNPYPADGYAQGGQGGQPHDPYAPAPGQGHQGQYPQQQYPQDQYGRPQPQHPHAQPQNAQGQYPPDQYAQPQAQDAYAQNQYSQDPYQQGHYAQDQYRQDQYGADQYGSEQYGPDPYAAGAYGAHPQNAHSPQSPQGGHGNYEHGPYPQPGPADQQPAAPVGAYEPQHGAYAQHQAPGPAQPQHPQYAQQQPPAAYGQDPRTQQQDPRAWAQAAPPAEGQGGHPPYGGQEQAEQASQYVGVDDLVSRAGAGSPDHDAFAHLFRDQQHDGPQRPLDPGAVPPPSPEPVPPPPAAARASGGGRASSILKSSAIMAAGTMVSRLTGFVRTVVITAALGAMLLGDAYTIAYTLPTMIYILTVGGGLNSVFVPQLVRSMKEDEDGGEAFANRLLTMVMVVLGVITVIVVFAAPLLIRLQSIPVANDAAANNVAVTFARYCLPTIFFMGVHVVMGQILNARGRFGAMMWTPVLNNIVMIFTFGLFIYVYGTADTTGMRPETIPPEGVRLLGIGTLLGLVVQALAMIPYLREAGFRFRPRFDWRGHGLGKTIKLAKWTVLFVLANQAGLIVVTQLATAAGKDAFPEGGKGFLAYTNAQLIWAMPQAIITVSVMAAILPRISRAAADNDPGAVRDDISQGLRSSAVAIVPVSFSFIALGIPICTLLYSSTGLDDARSMGYILMAFGVGLIPYSVQYVVLRGFYAYEDTRTPFYNTVIVAAVNAAASALCYLALPPDYAVIGMAASYGLAYAVGVGVAWKRLKVRLGGDLDGPQVLRTYARLCMASVPAALVSGALGYFVLKTMGQSVLGSIAALVVGGVALLAVFYVAARKMRIQELNSMVAMVRGRLGR
ncbi:murein biosynthesis integral membrane protein MurJ [Streptomyces sp. NA04227]|uniref:murein biosynthesis integral membrane protein MurJ n=1 Tax=Streptomyces sp. NA04227 TaxID=2742136 RepID=UPI001591AD3A|nr:murein biosynthesis integral membrane protein MurJ [Streptomyces sp. NA04227]QKW07805.1 murein biosynthesis integral membrane protein MurJ [Streptomyces sp. NA04227]